jgi:hypothetical protein
MALRTPLNKHVQNDGKMRGKYRLKPSISVGQQEGMYTILILLEKQQAKGSV